VGKVPPAAPPALLQKGLPYSATQLLGSASAEWPGSSTTPPGSTSGKVFFRGDDGLNYVCSGSTVNSGGKNVVFTAGHCVHGGGLGRRYFTNWAFVPGYRDNVRPYGTWTARQLWTLNGWSASGNRTYDIGAAVMNTDTLARHIVNRVGGQGIEWNHPLSQYVYQFGYPQRTPFNGQRLRYCTGTTFSDGGHEGILCNMTEGASGGPWLDDFNGTFGWLDSVNSWVFWNAQGVRYKWNGPYFGNAAANLYNAVANL
jgi:V8-like Glu-specific endopeptidase